MLVHRHLKNATCDEVTAFIKRNKFNIYDFTFTVSELIPKLKITADGHRNSLLKVFLII